MAPDPGPLKHPIALGMLSARNYLVLNILGRTCPDGLCGIIAYNNMCRVVCAASGESSLQHRTCIDRVQPQSDAPPTRLDDTYSQRLARLASPRLARLAKRSTSLPGRRLVIFTRGQVWRLARP